MGSNRFSHNEFCRTIGGDGCELTVCRTVSYARNEDLPQDIRSVLPYALQTVYRDAYEAALRDLASAGDVAPDPERAADQAGWRAVHRLYRQDGTTWVRRIPAQTAPGI